MPKVVRKKYERVVTYTTEYHFPPNQYNLVPVGPWSSPDTDIFDFVNPHQRYKQIQTDTNRSKGEEPTK